MKKLLFLLLIFPVTGLAQTGKDIFNPEVPMVFFGIDFTKVQFTRADDFTNKPEILRFFVDANNLIDHGSLRNQVSRQLERKSVEWDLSYVTAGNSVVDWRNVYSDNIDYVVPEDELNNMVKNLKVDQKKYNDFIGMVLIEENCCKAKPLQTITCLFFRVNDLTVLFAERYKMKPGGIGFMNYWGVNHNMILARIGRLKKAVG
ncbi:MAG TPA: hypothetical protein PKL65_00270 [Bacteroidales bacterium]|nr:hypothetical protein [Bacteroidales bacterium]HNR40638.1 hypothetical protein [Bacteroidales bacterium]HPM18082.1 hypothetical protein [Bacteroidales bacterium]HQG77266.1 hypothetical protein [Bacteroidales bacterium]